MPFVAKFTLLRDFWGKSCTTPPDHWDVGIWFGCMFVSWDPSQLLAVPNPGHPPFGICLAYQLFCTKKKVSWTFRSLDLLEQYLGFPNFPFLNFDWDFPLLNPEFWTKIYIASIDWRQLPATTPSSVEWIEVNWCKC